MEYTVLIWAILSGAFAGAVASTIGYLKAKKLEPWSYQKFGITAIVGMVVGGFAASQGWDYEGEGYQIAYEYLSMIGVIYIIEFIAKAAYRRLVPKKEKGKLYELKEEE